MRMSHAKLYLMLSDLVDEICDEKNEPALEKVQAHLSKSQSQKISQIAIQHNIKQDDPVWVLLQIVQNLQQISEAASNHCEELQLQKEKIVEELKLDTFQSAANSIALIFDEKSDELIEIMRAETQKNRMETAQTLKKFKERLDELATKQSKIYSAAAEKSILAVQAEAEDESTLEGYAIPVIIALVSGIFASASTVALLRILNVF